LEELKVSELVVNGRESDFSFFKMCFGDANVGRGVPPGFRELLITYGGDREDLEPE
jgi:hypothetical protein